MNTDTKPKWKSGPPPSVGWWPASRQQKPGILRWWDGEQWSEHARWTSSAGEAAKRAARPCWNASQVFWHNRPAWWPERSKT